MSLPITPRAHRLDAPGKMSGSRTHKASVSATQSAVVFHQTKYFTVYGFRMTASATVAESASAADAGH